MAETQETIKKNLPNVPKPNSAKVELQRQLAELKKHYKV